MREEEAGRSISTARLKRVQKEEPSDSSLPTKQALLNMHSSHGFAAWAVMHDPGGLATGIGVVVAHFIARASLEDFASAPAGPLRKPHRCPADGAPHRYGLGTMPGPFRPLGVGPKGSAAAPARQNRGGERQERCWRGGRVGNGRNGSPRKTVCPPGTHLPTIPGTRNHWSALGPAGVCSLRRASFARAAPPGGTAAWDRVHPHLAAAIARTSWIIQAITIRR
jgi:hypothetical protein